MDERDELEMDEEMLEDEIEAAEEEEEEEEAS